MSFKVTPKVAELVNILAEMREEEISSVFNDMSRIFSTPERKKYTDNQTNMFMDILKFDGNDIVSLGQFLESFLGEDVDEE